MNKLTVEKSEKKRPELLCPVANWDMLFAAIHNGANAIYLGFPGFNARARTNDFDWSEIKEMIETCHLYGVQVHLALNILIFQNELDDIINNIQNVVNLGADAIIVQDLGLARLFKKALPHQTLHASTQMTVTSELIIKNLEDLDIDRFVLGREVSLKEMKSIKASTNKEIEVFVHGALCVAYSGQCLTSERIGGRSANRGQCAQSCRLDFELHVDGVKKQMGEYKYLMSPKDLCGIDHIPELIDMGIDSFKVEGRYKAPEYVAAAANNYTKKINSYLLNTEEDINVDELEKTFSRTFFNGWYNGVNHQELVDGRFSNHRGLDVGTVKRIHTKKMTALEIESKTKLFAGDGVLICDQLQQPLVGAKIFEVNKLENGNYNVSFDNSIKLNQITDGSVVYVNSSPQLDKKLEKSFKNRDQWKRVSINISITAKLNQQIQIQGIDYDGNTIDIKSENKIEEAQKNSATEEDFKTVFKANGPSAFSFIVDKIDLDQNLFIHKKVMKNLKKLAIEKMSELRKKTKTLETSPSSDELKDWLSEDSKNIPQYSEHSKLNVLIREPEQVKSLEGLKLGRVYLDFKHGKAYRKSVQLLKEMGHEVFICTTRILKSDKLRLLDIIDDIKPDGVLIRNLGALEYFKDKYNNNIPYKLVGDFSLNVTNSLSASYLINKGLNTITPSYDLNRNQLLDLLAISPGNNFEVTIHQYMPSFHMEHCVFAAFLSNGSSIKDCGMVCREHDVKIKDPYGVTHPIFPDQECRNTMFNGIPQSSSFLANELQSKGVRNFRFEALNEDTEELRNKIEAYLNLVSGKITSSELISELGTDERYGISAGQLNSNKVYKDRKKQI